MFECISWKTHFCSVVPPCGKIVYYSGYWIRINKCFIHCYIEVYWFGQAFFNDILYTWLERVSWSHRTDCCQIHLEIAPQLRFAACKKHLYNFSVILSTCVMSGSSTNHSATICFYGQSRKRWLRMCNNASQPEGGSKEPPCSSTGLMKFSISEAS